MRLSFAGRNSELEQLRTLYLQGRHVLIVGPPGIGKTALLNEFRTRAPLLVCKDTSKLTSTPAFAAGWSRSLAEVITGFRYSSGNVACWPTSRSLESPLRSIMSLTLPRGLRGLWRGSVNTFPFGSRAVLKCLIKLDASGNIYRSSSN